MDVERQVCFWRDSSMDDMEAAEVLVQKDKYRHGLFFAHLALEKLLKAHVTRVTQDIAPRIHNLLRLAEIAEVPFSPEQKDFLNTFALHHTEGRYPDEYREPISQQETMALLQKAKEIQAWLMKRL